MSVYLVPRGIILTCKGLLLGRVNCLTIFKLVETWSAPITIPKSSISNFGKYGQNHIFESQHFCLYSFKAFYIIYWCLLNIFGGFVDVFQFNLSCRLSILQKKHHFLDTLRHRKEADVKYFYQQGSSLAKRLCSLSAYFKL